MSELIVEAYYSAYASGAYPAWHEVGSCASTTEARKLLRRVRGVGYPARIVNTAGEVIDETAESAAGEPR